MVFALAAAAVTLACGARTPLLYDQWCQGDTLPVETQVPSLYFVLDHSRSMREANKWDQVRTVVASVIGSVGARASFGVTMYPGQATVACSVGAEVMPLTRGDALGPTGPAVQKFLQVTSATPEGGTPTAATLLDLAQRLSGVPNAVAILATDGGPNCNEALSCDFDTCVLNMEGLNGCVPNQPPNCCQSSAQNCLDDLAAYDAVAALRSAGVPTYVVGIPGSEAFGSVLDAMALRGGTARPGVPRYYRVESEQALAGALGEISDKVTRACVLELTKAPKMPAGVKVSVRGTERARGADWTLEATRLTLLGKTCTDFDGDKTAVHVEDGCIPVPR